MFIAALTFYLIFLGGYIIFLLAVLFHFQKYRIPDEPYPFFIKLISLVLTLLLVLSIFAFLKVPWNDISFSY